MSRWPKNWLGYEWGRCVKCKSVQKLMSKREFIELSPTYDPGYLSAERSDLEASLDVDGKVSLLLDIFDEKPEGNLLDIGCGMGGFLLAGARLGLAVQGVEPSASHSKAAIDVFGFNVACRYFKSEDFNTQFDIVILSHVVEHIYDPREFLADVMKVVKEGGRLIVITPNCDSLASRICGRYWSMYKTVDHVTMFTKAAIRESLPQGTTLERINTSEWRGEFAAHIASALLTAFRSTSSSVDVQKIGGATRQSNIGAASKLVLAALSFPFHVLAGALDRSACLYAVLVKDGTK